MYLDLLGGYRGFPKLLLLVLEALLMCKILIIKAYGLVLELDWILLNWFGLVCSDGCMQIIIIGGLILEITTKTGTQRGQGGCGGRQ
mgnify:CR=1 FL=1